MCPSDATSSKKVNQPQMKTSTTEPTKLKQSRKSAARDDDKTSSSSEENTRRKQKRRAKAHGTSDESDMDRPRSSKKSLKRKRKAKVAVEVVLDDEEDVECLDDKAEVEEIESLDENQRLTIPAPFRTKHESTRDFLTIFTIKVQVNFNKKGQPSKDKSAPLHGRWCVICKDTVEEEIRARQRPEHTFRQCFFVGSNSSCRTHIRSYHYEEYKARCEAAKPPIPLHPRCIPADVLKAESEEKGKRKSGQQKIEFLRVGRPVEYTKEGVLDAVARLIACDDQALMLADKASFRNCLVSMRPITKTSELPSTHNVKVHIHNQFVLNLEGLKKQIQSAQGKVSATADGWTADTTKAGYLGMTAHWIDVNAQTQAWTLRAEVVGFQLLHGTHAGGNLGRYFVGLCDRVGIISPKSSKLAAVTLDNTSSNNTFCEAVESLHAHRFLPRWPAAHNQLPCLEHVINLANVDVMSHITKIAVVETTNAIWEYDPSDLGNRVLNGRLDVIAVIRTLTIKIQASGQRIQYFEKLQIECGITTPLKIPLHSNTRWGSAYGMLSRAHELSLPINLFVSSADQLYGPITTLRREGRVIKRIPWTAFALEESDWDRVRHAQSILSDSKKVLHHFSAEKQATLYRALPAIEELQSMWETRADNPVYELYRDAIKDGLAKLGKYYSKFDSKPAYVLSLALHPYFKLQYIQRAWGGAEEQAEERAAGNKDAKNWYDEALKVLEDTMAKYWSNRPQAAKPTETLGQCSKSSASFNGESDSLLSEYDRHRQTLISEEADEEWTSELRRYLKEVPADVRPTTDIVQWWSDHAKVYPTLARIALDILPMQGSSVPCERVFSGAKLIATDRRARLSPTVFEELQVLKFAWRDKQPDWAALNGEEIEEVDEIDEMSRCRLAEENELKEWDEEFNTPNDMIVD